MKHARYYWLLLAGRQGRGIDPERLPLDQIRRGQKNLHDPRGGRAPLRGAAAHASLVGPILVPGGSLAGHEAPAADGDAWLQMRIGGRSVCGFSPSRRHSAAG